MLLALFVYVNGIPANSEADVIVSFEIDNPVMCVNGIETEIDEGRGTSPVILNGRTLVPVRAIVEAFGGSVKWDESTRTVSLFMEENEYNALMSELPLYSGEAFVRVNKNIPFFRDYEIINGSFEFYGNLDELGRCDVCFASIGKDIMPTEERESIGSVTPSGWINVSCDVVEGKYLYNRCHLIGFQLTGENANERNLITGTRYLNVDGMLPFENDIAEYIEETGNRVMYRATPVFSGNNLVAVGVLLEAYSVEDEGRGISFCVYCYNVQPGIYRLFNRQKLGGRHNYRTAFRKNGE